MKNRKSTKIIILSEGLVINEQKSVSSVKKFQEFRRSPSVKYMELIGRDVVSTGVQILDQDWRKKAKNAISYTDIQKKLLF